MPSNPTAAFRGNNKPPERKSFLSLLEGSMIDKTYYSRFYYLRRYILSINSLFGSSVLGWMALPLIFLLVLQMVKIDNSIISIIVIAYILLIAIYLLIQFSISVIELKSRNNWIKSNGSKHLQMLLEERQDWERLYWKERISVDWPNYFMPQIKPISSESPSLELIQMVRSVRAEYPWAEVKSVNEGSAIWIANGNFYIVKLLEKTNPALLRQRKSSKVDDTSRKAKRKLK